jgi:hypothetical protein
MKFTDTERLDFLEKWETSTYQHSWFTLLTQHVRKKDFPTLREFCDYSIDFEKMIDSNGLEILTWHSLTPDLQEIVITIWENEGRALTAEEKGSMQKAFNQYWEELHKLESESSDK